VRRRSGSIHNVVTGQEKASDAQTCNACGSGQYRAANVGTDDCSTCSGGETRRRRATSCNECGVGKYSPVGETCDTCGSGKQAQRRRAAGHGACTACPSGRYKNTAGDDCSTCTGEVNSAKTACSPCGPGKLWHGGSGRCVACNGVMRRRRASSCEECPSSVWWNFGTGDSCLPEHNDGAKPRCVRKHACYPSWPSCSSNQFRWTRRRGEFKDTPTNRRYNLQCRRRTHEHWIVCCETHNTFYNSFNPNECSAANSAANNCDDSHTPAMGT